MFRKSDVRRKSIVSYALSYKKIVVRYLVHRTRGLVDQQSVASEVTTLWRYTNLFIIIIIIITHNRLKSLTDCRPTTVCLSVSLQLNADAATDGSWQRARHGDMH